MKIDHAALYVTDLEGAKAFFETYLGALSNLGYYNPNTRFRSYFLSFDDGCRLELMTRPELTAAEKAPYPCGYAHLAFNVGSADEVDRLTERFRKDGYRVIGGPRTTGDGYYESCIEGFEGNLIEITI